MISSPLSLLFWALTDYSVSMLTVHETCLSALPWCWCTQTVFKPRSDQLNALSFASKQVLLVYSHSQVSDLCYISSCHILFCVPLGFLLAVTVYLIIFLQRGLKVFLMCGQVRASSLWNDLFKTTHVTTKECSTSYWHEVFSVIAQEEAGDYWSNRPGVWLFIKV